ncbi:hypothetical protein Ait01nite_069780 [Actinoplanes italicus]|uniref:hypothetical protein n=1 Tax=Actinoplanes italicus TaxID=113567 RepID=UPI0014757D48|nr:hypothetical protein [Actinoplanes italicus]GIE33933.1 hypothetical protein Ait01nite_069780 [Actinoplanes italicus]
MIRERIENSENSEAGREIARRDWTRGFAQGYGEVIGETIGRVVERAFDEGRRKGCADSMDLILLAAFGGTGDSVGLARELAESDLEGISGASLPVPRWMS